jgi:hypothetical protein
MQQAQGAARWVLTRLEPRFHQPQTVPSPALSDAPPAARGGAVPRALPWGVLWLAVFAGCLAPAALNGHPVVFGDLLDYLRAARDFRPTHERAFGYGAFLRATGGLASLWLPAAAQAALAAALAVRLLSLEAPGWPARGRRLWLVGGSAAVLLAGHLPWQASFVMPDVFAGVMVLALLLVSGHWARLGIWERVRWAAVLAGAATVHLTHPPLLLGLAFAAGAAGLLLPMAVPRLSAALMPARRAAALALAAAAFGWGTLVAANFATHREATPASGGPVFLFARLQADTDAPRILRAPCEAGAGFALCRHLDRMAADRPSADEFLWDWGRKALLPELGWMAGFRAEARALNPVLLREGWRDWLAASAGRAAAQLVGFGLGDGMDRAGAGVLTEGLPDLGMAGEAAAIASARQVDDRLVPLMPRRLADGLAAAGLLALLGSVVLGLLRGRAEVWWPALLFLVAWVGNAALVALGGEVHGRYGARLVWVAPLLAGVLASRALRPPLPAGRPCGWTDAHAPPDLRRRIRFRAPGSGRRSPASSRLSATARHFSRHLRRKARRRASISCGVAA